MTTATWSTPCDHTTTAGYRAWGSEFNTKLALVGMVQTADTGQINWTTTTLPIANTINGYEIWRLSSSNLYFKLSYGTGNATNAPVIQMQVGTGSNGSGTLTGTLSTNVDGRTVGSTNLSSSVTNFQSYLCATADYLYIGWKFGGYTSAPSGASVFLLAARTVDSTGAATSVGYQVIGGNGASGFVQNVATTAGVVGTATAFNSASNFTMVFGATGAIPATSQDGSGNNQAFLWWFSILGTTPVLPMLHGATILQGDLANGSTASLTLVGSTPHTYIGAGLFFAPTGGGVSASSLRFLCLWE